MLIDIHTHAFHPKIAAKAVVHLNQAYQLTCQGSGSLTDLAEEEALAGIDRYTVLCAATSPSQVIPANTFAMHVRDSSDGHAIAFGTLHPGDTDWEQELDRLARHGIRALKLHPDFQGFRLDDPRLRPIFEACSGRFLILFHIGSHTEYLDAAPTSPKLLADILRNFPRLDVIGAHFCAYRMWESVSQYFEGKTFPHLWTDTSSTSPFVSDRELKRLLKIFPADRCLFGSDWPLYKPAEERNRMTYKTGFSDRQIEQLMSNAAPLLSQYGLLSGEK